MLNLTPAELLEVTGKQRPGAQMRALNAMNIPGRLRPDNVVIVSRDAYLIAMGVEKFQNKNRANNEPDYSAF